MEFRNYEYLIYIVVSVFVPLLLLVSYSFYRRNFIKRIIKSDRSREMIVAAGYGRIAVKESLLALAILLCAIVLLKPSWGTETKKVEREGADVLIALDVSRSMLAADVAPNRLERAKAAVRWITESLKGDRIGLIVFAGDAFMMCPLTGDIDAFLQFLDSVGPDSVNLQGTNFGSMLGEAKKVFSRKRMTSKMLIVISDGEDHENSYDSYISFFKENAIEVYTLGIGRGEGDFIPSSGDKSTADLYYRDFDGNLIKTRKNRGLLENLSRSTSGKYIDITSSLSGLNDILGKIDRQQQNYFGSKIITERTDRTGIFLFALVVILMIEAFIGDGKPLKRKRKDA